MLALLKEQLHQREVIASMEAGQADAVMSSQDAAVTSSSQDAVTSSSRDDERESTSVLLERLSWLRHELSEQQRRATDELQNAIHQVCNH
jgi:hypothetical protein